MTDSNEPMPPGWYHAEGDPAGTERYWNGTQWDGEPRPVGGAGVQPPANPFGDSSGGGSPFGTPTPTGDVGGSTGFPTASAPETPSFGAPTGGFPPSMPGEAPPGGVPGWGAAGAAGAAAGGFGAAAGGFGGGMPMAAPKNETLAIVSLVLGILSIPMVCCSVFSLPINIGAIVTGYMGMNKVKASGGALKGREMAIAGMVLGAIAIVLVILFLILGTVDLSGNLG